MVIIAGVRLLLVIVGLGVIQPRNRSLQRSLLFVPLVFAGGVTLDNFYGAKFTLLPLRWAMPGLGVTAVAAIFLLVAGKMRPTDTTFSDDAIGELQACGTVILFLAGMATGIYWLALSVCLPISVVGFASIVVVPFCGAYLMTVLIVAGMNISGIIDATWFVARGRSLRVFSEDLMNSNFVFELSACAGFFLASSFTLTLITLLIGHHFYPLAWVPQTAQMFAANVACDFLSFHLFNWSLVRSSEL